MTGRHSLTAAILWPLLLLGAACSERESGSDDGKERVIVVIAHDAVTPFDVERFESRNAYSAFVLSEAMQSLDMSGETVERFSSVPVMVMRVDAEQRSRLESSSLVTGIYKDELNEPFLAESGPLIGLPAAREAGATGRGQAVAILDSGVDAGHPFVAGRIAAEACFSSSGSLLGTSQMVSACPAGETQSSGPGAGAPCDADYSGCDHGTHVAGIAAGKGEGVFGAAPEANLISAQVFTLMEGPVCGDRERCILAFDSDILRAMDWLLTLSDTLDIAAVNLSLGGGQFSGACDTQKRPYAIMIERLVEKGIAVVAASGNEAFEDAIAAPACVGNAISVGASDKTDAVAVFSNSTRGLDLMAPGALILSSVPGGSFALKSGTSMAAPHVAGAIAALRSAGGQDTDEIVTALRDTGTPIVDERNGVVARRIDVAKAAQVIRAANPNGASRPAAVPAGASPPPQQGETGLSPEALVRQYGKVRVICTLAVGEDETTNPAAISRVREQLLREMQMYRTEGVETFKHAPVLSMTVDAGGLAYLRRSRHVKTITADALNLPSAPSGETDGGGR